MNQPTLLEFTHSTKKIPVTIIKEQIFCFYFDIQQKATIIVGPGAGFIAVSESEEKVREAYLQTS